MDFNFSLVTETATWNSNFASSYKQSTDIPAITKASFQGSLNNSYIGIA